MQAVEAKEGVEIQNETVTLASISYQNFFRSYPVGQISSHLPTVLVCCSWRLAFIVQAEIWACCLQKLAGMTGTAATEAAEFSNIYKLEVTEVPTNKPLSRTDNPDVVFRSEAGGSPRPPPPATAGNAAHSFPVHIRPCQRAPSLESLSAQGHWSSGGMRCLL